MSSANLENERNAHSIHNLRPYDRTIWITQLLIDRQLYTICK